MDSFMHEIRKIPPVTRLLSTATLGVSIPVMLQVVSPYKILFVKQLVTEGWEIWRPFTSFFFGGTGINFLFEFIMLYRNSDGLESGHYAGRSADYAWQLLLSCAGILALNLPLKSYLHFRPLLMSLVYLSSRLTPSAQVSIFGLISLQNQYFPYALLAMDLVMGGPQSAAASLTGVITGHAWWYLVHSEESGRPGAAYARAPAWLRGLVGDGPGVANTTRGGPVPGRGAAPPRAAQPMGHSWGSGHRLGST